MVAFPSCKMNLNPDIGSHQEAKKELARSQTGKTVRRKNMGNLMATGPFNPLNAELNPIRHLLALVGARHIVHVSRIRVKVEIMLEETGD